MVATRSRTAAAAVKLSPDTSAGVPSTVTSAGCMRKRARDDGGVRYAPAGGLLDIVLISRVVFAAERNQEAPESVQHSGEGVHKRARFAGAEVSTARTITECTTQESCSSALTDERTTEILRDASARLVWSRVDEVEGLKMSLEELGRVIDELGRATSRAEAIHRRVEARVDRDLASARKVAAVRLLGVERVRFEHPFSKFFYTLIGHLLPSN